MKEFYCTMTINVANTILNDKHSNISIKMICISHIHRQYLTLVKISEEDLNRFKCIRDKFTTADCMIPIEIFNT